MNSQEELERLKTEFRNSRLGMYEQAPGMFESEEQMLASATQLRDFCIAGGHDLEELNSFFKEVETDFQSIIPK
jgi:hypothetical protein